jgi:hypothetical protein
MTDHFTDVHQMHHIGNIFEHSLDGQDVSMGIKMPLGEELTRADGIHELAIKNPQGGEDVYHGTSLVEKIIPNAAGGHDVYDANMHLKGSIIPNVHHGHDVLHEGNLVESTLPIGHGVSTVMHYEDPLAHYSEFAMTKLILE